ncbi:hypothetical protein HYU22_04385 [Candidatus Woesearchaeota archaeon]|nr:hypothetical protein [Candidatus Woesearchaeota archaeon]
MEFWNSLLTEKSWDLLQELQKKPFKFIVIGGWAAYLWTRMHKSKDIDIVIADFKDLQYLKEEYDLKKNEALKKYEIQFGEIDVDIYVAYYSPLALPIPEIKKHTAKVEGITVVSPEVLLILKQGAEADRELSVKGQKDRIDIMALLFFSGINFGMYRQLLQEHRLEHLLPRLRRIIAECREYNYLNLNPLEFKRKKKELLNLLAK